MSFVVLSEIEEVWVFGSYARGDHTPDSDLDLLVVSKTPDLFVDASLVQECFDLPQLPEISLYTPSGISRLISPPSLFAWHLRREGQVIYSQSTWLADVLSSMLPYSGHLKDIRVIWQLHLDLKRSLYNGSTSLVFDAGVLHTIARNTAMILCDLIGEPDFSPYAPLKIADKCLTLRFPLSIENYVLLSKCRLSAERGSIPPKISHSDLMSFVSIVDMWLRLVTAFIKEKVYEAARVCGTYQRRKSNY